MRLARLFLVALLAIPALLAIGCERTFFRYVNRGLPPPDQSAIFAPELGLAMDIYRPQQAANKAPIVVFFYGGAWQRGQKSQYRFVGRRLAENGILAIVADYRTYPRVRFPDFMGDAARAVRFARDNAAAWGGDPQRLFVAGYSAGAHIAALLATDARYLKHQGMVPGDLSGAIGLSGPYDFVVSGRLLQVFGSSEQWPQAQPVNFVDGDEPPFLLVHGLRDRVVESADSVELADLLRKHGVSVTLELLPEGTHITSLAGLYDPKREPKVLRSVVDFIDTEPRNIR